MEINVIHIYGGSGSGTSTLGYAFPANRAIILWMPMIISGFRQIRGLLKCEKAENGSG